MGFLFGFVFGVNDSVNEGGGGGKPRLPIGGGGRSKGGAGRPAIDGGGGGGGGGGNIEFGGWICISCFDVSKILVIFLTLFSSSGYYSITVSIKWTDLLLYDFLPES